MKDTSELETGKSLIIAEADRKFKKEIARIKADLLTAPAPEKYIQSELDFIDRLLRTPEHINPRHDCILDVVKGLYKDGEVFKEWYFMIDTRGFPLNYVRMLRHEYKMYLSGKINFIGEKLTDKTKVIADAIMFFKLGEWLENYKPDQPTVSNYVNELAQIAEAENKFKKGVPMQAVVDHFKIMTTKKNKNGTHYLTPDQFVSFLKRGFLKDHSQPQQKVNCAAGEKGFVIKRFYEFFDLAVSHYGYPNKKHEFIDLFTDCFNNWDPNTIKPFFGPDKVKERW